MAWLMNLLAMSRVFRARGLLQAPQAVLPVGITLEASRVGRMRRMAFPAALLLGCAVVPSMLDLRGAGGGAAAIGVLGRRLQGEELSPDDDPAFLLYCLAAASLVVVSATMSGLFLGLMSIDPIELEIFRHGGGTAEQKAEADIVWPLVSAKGHRLLVTLLLMNFCANEAMPIVLDKLLPTYVAFLMSVVLVVFLGEMFPMAVFTGPRQLHLASLMCPLVWVLIFLTTPIAWPIAKLLDFVLGDSSTITRYNRQQMQTLVNLHQKRNAEQLDEDEETAQAPFLDPKMTLGDDEVKIMSSALNLVNRTACDVMTPFNLIKMMPLNAKLDEYTLAGLVSTGHSRIPVYNGTIHNICGFIMMKNLVTLDPLLETPVSAIKLYRPVAVHRDTTLMDMLKLFQMGRSHMAIVTSNPNLVNRSLANGTPLAPGTILGLMTCEDVLEELIGEEFQDKPLSKVKLAEQSAVGAGSQNLASPWLHAGSTPSGVGLTERTTNFHNAAIKSSLSQAFVNKFDRLLERSKNMQSREVEKQKSMSRMSAGGKTMSYTDLDIDDERRPLV
mmetsp:Transcript_41535/g.77830  ORF Transcript_41535/g.77830 Transcript_41535/m.77830 type:complete len:556 (-) Transcript_41535:281-1948(-)